MAETKYFCRNTDNAMVKDETKKQKLISAETKPKLIRFYHYYYRVTKVLGDTYYVDIKIRVASSI